MKIYKCTKCSWTFLESGPKCMHQTDNRNQTVIADTDDRQRIAELEQKCDEMYQRGIESNLPLAEDRCDECGGVGRKSYGSTSMWRGGIGGQMITIGPCDKCWGSGEKYRKFADMRKIESKLRLNESRIAELEQQLSAMTAERFKLAEFIDYNGYLKNCGTPDEIYDLVKTAQKEHIQQARKEPENE